jgi:hypothetical protein
VRFGGKDTLVPNTVQFSQVTAFSLARARGIVRLKDGFHSLPLRTDDFLSPRGCRTLSALFPSWISHAALNKKDRQRNFQHVGAH